MKLSCTFVLFLHLLNFAACMVCEGEWFIDICFAILDLIKIPPGRLVDGYIFYIFIIII